MFTFHSSCLWRETYFLNWCLREIIDFEIDSLMARKLGANFPHLIHAKCVEITTLRIPWAAIGNSGYSTISRKCQNREDGAIYLEQNRLKSPFSHEVIFSLFTLPHKISSRRSGTGKIMCNSLIFWKTFRIETLVEMMWQMLSIKCYCLLVWQKCLNITFILSFRQESSTWTSF